MGCTLNVSKAVESRARDTGTLVFDSTCHSKKKKASGKRHTPNAIVFLASF